MTKHDNLVRKPSARTDELVSESFDDGRVIYDERTHAAHSLRSDVATIWDLCDGRRSPADIAGYLRLDLQFVEQALYELERCDLLEPEMLVTADGGHFDRRTLLKRTAAVGGGAVLIATAFVPPAFAFGSVANSTAVTYTVTGTNANGGQSATGTSSGSGDTGPTKTLPTSFPTVAAGGANSTFCSTKGNVTATAPTGIGYVAVFLGISGTTPQAQVENDTQFSLTYTIVSNGVTLKNAVTLTPGQASGLVNLTAGDSFTITVS